MARVRIKIEEKLGNPEMTGCRVDVFKLSIDRGGFECRSPSGTKLNYVDMAIAVQQSSSPALDILQLVFNGDISD